MEISINTDVMPNTIQRTGTTPRAVLLTTMPFGVPLSKNKHFWVTKEDYHNMYSSLMYGQYLSLITFLRHNYKNITYGDHWWLILPEQLRHLHGGPQN